MEGLLLSFLYKCTKPISISWNAAEMLAGYFEQTSHRFLPKNRLRPPLAVDNLNLMVLLRITLDWFSFEPVCRGERTILQIVGFHILLTRLCHWFCCFNQYHLFFPHVVCCSFMIGPDSFEPHMRFCSLLAICLVFSQSFEINNSHSISVGKVGNLWKLQVARSINH